MDSANRHFLAWPYHMGFWQFVQPSPAADSRRSIDVGPMTSVVHHPGHLRIVKLVAADPQPGRIWIRCGTVSEKNVEIRYWVARGIGHFWFLGETLTLERIRRPLPGGLPADGEESHPAEP